MSNITEWINNELYPSLFDRIDEVFPEHDFKQFSGGWRSKTYLDGSPHKTRNDKTNISKRAPGRIGEWGYKNVSIIDYIMERDSLDFMATVKKLATIAGLQVPLTPLDQTQYKRYQEKATALEDANSYFIYCLEKGGHGAQEVKTYLLSRGYTEEEIKNMELGYIPSQDKLFKYLQEKGHSESIIKEVLGLNTDIGKTHKLTIPYRAGGSLKGFKFRSISEGAKHKYINSSGLDKLGGFFNLSSLKGDKELVIVEGELDSLHATVKGLENIVAAGGDSFNKSQVEDAIKRGAKKFTICFDREPGKEETTIGNTLRAIDTILGAGGSKVYVALLDDLGGGKTDPDRLLKERGVIALKEAITSALPYWGYWLQLRINKALESETEEGLSPKERDTLLEGVVSKWEQIVDPLDKDQYKKAFIDLDVIQGLGITEEALDATLEKITATRSKERQSKEFSSLIREATELGKSGKMEEALNLLRKKAREVQLHDKVTGFRELLCPTTEREVIDRLQNKPDSISTGLKIGDQEIILPSGALTVLAGPTSHGKTTFLINLALNVCDNYPGKQAYLFSYEEDGDTMLINTLSTYMDLSLGRYGTKWILKRYFHTGSEEYVTQNKEEFLTKKSKFFKELVETGRLNIKYVNYDMELLADAIRYLHKYANPGVIFIDYIQLLNIANKGKNVYSRQEELKEICGILKDLSIETGLPIVLGAQFNRDVKSHTHIHLNKIGEAGDIERIANLIIGFWNNDFEPSGTEKELDLIVKKGIDEEGTIYAKVLKNRGGKVGVDGLIDYNNTSGKMKTKLKNSSHFD